MNKLFPYNKQASSDAAGRGNLVKLARRQNYIKMNKQISVLA
jgi:hypothetical protein